MVELLIEDDPGVTIEDDLSIPTVKRPSDPFKQFGAGITDIATGLPALLGLAGAGLEGGFNTLTGEGGFKENFALALSEGLDKTLLEAGLSGREAVNEFLGIEEAISTEDQAARLLGSFIPIPGLQLVSGASKFANVARGAFNVLTPAVRLVKTSKFPFRDKLLGKVTEGTLLNRGNIGRVGAQLGIGAGIEQGIRAVIDDPNLPLAFSERALQGGASSDILIEDDIEEDFDIDPALLASGQDGFEARRELDIKVQRQQDWDDIKFWTIVAGAAAGTYAGLKFSQTLALKKAAATAPFGLPEVPQGKVSKFFTDVDPANALDKGVLAYARDFPGTLNQGKKDVLQYIGEAFVDKDKALYNALIAQGHSKETANAMLANSHIDTVGMSQRVIDTGQFGQGFQGGVFGNGITHAIRDLEVEHAALGDTKELFDRGMLAQTIKATRDIDDKSPIAIWGVQKPHTELDEMINAANANPEVRALMDKFSEVFGDHLEYQKFRGLITDKEVKAFRAKHLVDDKLTYMPLYTASRKDFFQRMSRKFGIHTSKAEELNIMGEFHTRGPDGVSTPLGPMEALRQYTVHSIDNANRSAYKAQSLFNLSGVQVKTGVVHRFFLDADGKAIATRAPRRVDHTGRGTTYIGKGQIDEATDAVVIDLDGNYTGPVRAGTVNDMKAQTRVGSEIVTVQHEGELLAFHVPDAAIRASLDMNPQLGAFLHFMNHYKSLFTRFTTGNLSLFSPISHLFSSQQIALATAGREGLLQGVKSMGRSVKGTKELFIANTAKELAQYLSFRVATQTGIGKIAPQWVARRAKSLEERFRSSMLNDIRGETGRISSGLQADTFTGSVADFADSVGRNFGNKYGMDEMGLVWRMWKGWNTAMHEGPAFGVMQRIIGEARLAGKEIDGKVLREAADASKSVAGDMRRIGASQAAKAFNASVPFSAAMIQSWNALGSAAMHDWKAFSTGAAIIVGVPTATEILHAALLGEEGEKFADASGREWTYNDYYWNGYTTQQRADNFIYMIPGKPPWEAIIMPVSPEWGLFRGMIMEGMDALFDFSRTGAIGEADQDSDKVGRQQLWAAAARVLDVPLPPIVAAAFSAAGIDVRLGLSVEEKFDPDDPGAGLSVLRAIPLGQGERITRRAGRSRYAQDSLDTDVVAILQDIFGSGGAVYVGMHNALFSGKKSLPGDDSLTGLSGAMAAFGDGMRRQARWTQPLFGQTLRPKASDEIALNVFNRRQALRALGNNFNAYFSDGLLGRNGRPITGNTNVPPDDPINFELAADAKAVEKMISVLDEDIADLRRQISSDGNATNLGNIRERSAIIDAKVLQIQSLKAKQLASMIDYERRASDILSERYGRTIDINLATFKPRSNLQASSISQELRK